MIEQKSEQFVTYPKRRNELWLSEFSSDNLKLSLRLKGVIHSEQTKYQELLIADSYEYGRVLMLDGAFQLTERDEFCYSEMMAHVAICANAKPERVLIIGGGDGAVLREVLKHDCVKKCTLIDIDERVIDLSKKFMPNVSYALNDPRADVRCMDALKFIDETDEKFDVIIADSTDPVDFAAGLFRADFYAKIKNLLTETGMFTELTESPFTDRELMRQAISEMRKVFPIVKMCWGVVPTYPSGMWTYGVASMRDDPAEPVREISATRYYTREIHRAAFELPPFLKELIS